MTGWRESKGSNRLFALLQELLPGYVIEPEYSLGERLALDFYCDAYKLGLEYHGRQHFEYVEFFHGNLKGFHESQDRDARKLELCKEQGIAIVSFDYREELSKELVFDRVLKAISSTDTAPKNNKKEDPFHEQRLERQREYRRKQYRRQKEWRDGRKNS